VVEKFPQHFLKRHWMGVNYFVRNFLGNFLGSVPEILEKNLEDHDQGDVQDRVGREEGTEIEDECDWLRCGLQYEACES
jgi:hypothetical protein